MKKAIILLTVLFHLGGCSKDDEYVVDVALSGAWTLNSASCFCYFGDDFDFSDHRLTFDSSEQKVVVQNSEKTSFITESGTYTFGTSAGASQINLYKNSGSHSLYLQNNVGQTRAFNVSVFGATALL